MNLLKTLWKGWKTRWFFLLKLWKTRWKAVHRGFLVDKFSTKGLCTPGACLDNGTGCVYNKNNPQLCKGVTVTMKHIQTLETRDMAKSLQNGGCGECQTSCQSACKTSCGIANQPCEKAED